MTYKDKVRKAAKQLTSWTDAQLQHAWDNPKRRKDGAVTLKAAQFCDAILYEQYRRRNRDDEVGQRWTDAQFV